MGEYGRLCTPYTTFPQSLLSTSKFRAYLQHLNPKLLSSTRKFRLYPQQVHQRSTSQLPGRDGEELFGGLGFRV